MAMAGDAIFRGVVLMESCIHCGDTVVERRPYHKYCTCALHKNAGGGGLISPRSKLISYPMKRSWSEGNLAIIGGGASSPSSAAASPGSGLKRTQTQESLLSSADF